MTHMRTFFKHLWPGWIRCEAHWPFSLTLFDESLLICFRQNEDLWRGKFKIHYKSRESQNSLRHQWNLMMKSMCFTNKTLYVLQLHDIVCKINPNHLVSTSDQWENYPPGSRIRMLLYTAGSSYHRFQGKDTRHWAHKIIINIIDTFKKRNYSITKIKRSFLYFDRAKKQIIYGTSFFDLCSSYNKLLCLAVTFMEEFVSWLIKVFAGSGSSGSR